MVPRTAGVPTSAWSAPVSVTTPRLPAPGNYRCAATSANTIEITWAPLPVEVTYLRYRSSGPFSFQEAPPTGFTDTGLAPNTRYLYRLYATYQPVRHGRLYRSAHQDVRCTTVKAELADVKADLKMLKFMHGPVVIALLIKFVFFP